ncbi:transglutaminase TgpA family protein [Kribbella sp. CA-247076]|uniref:transglutaminase TgpA family protein n=1 Tax=Kribbella sp. CA-247076 TaxID=3239941 RepID=UPI003D8AA884
MSRRQTVAVLAGVLVGGLCFGPVFGLGNLWLSVAAVCVVAYLATEACRQWPRLTAWRPLLVAAGGLLAVVETVLRATTVVGLPRVESVRALGRGLDSWHLTLQSTWPARPDPELVVFVPLLTLVACLLAIELLDRAPPLVALLPAVAVLGVSQLYLAATGLTAVLIAVAFGLIVIALLIPDTTEYRRLAPWVATSAVTVAAIVTGLVVGAIDPAGRTPYSLQKVQAATVAGTRWPSPLDELGSRLGSRGTDKDDVLFRYSASEPVDRWRLVALDDFDGANWTTDHPLLRMGTELTPGPEIRVPTTEQRASVRLEQLDGPWLPGQLLPSTVGGVTEPQVEPIGSTLLAPQRPDRYELAWREPVVDSSYLLGAGIDADAPGGLSDLGPVPPEISELNPLQGKRATFSTALALEKYLRDNYQVAVDGRLPTGHSWPQLRAFLLKEQPGTSEQFAAGYVALARLNGIPARLAVGFRAPAEPDADGLYTVRDSDAYAWPEVAVDGVGWWPLDPVGRAASGKTSVAGSTAEITEQARAAVPPVEQIEDPEVPPSAGEGASNRSWGGFRLPLLWVFVISAGLLLLWLAGVPLLKFARALRRRRRGGSASVVGAWTEARDRLRAHGVPVTAGMTVRDLAEAARELPDTGPGLDRVARAVDHALWSGGAAGGELSQQAWTGVRELRKALRSRPLLDRLQASLEVRTLFTR